MAFATSKQHIKWEEIELPKTKLVAQIAICDLEQSDCLDLEPSIGSTKLEATMSYAQVCGPFQLLHAVLPYGQQQQLAGLPG